MMFYVLIYAHVVAIRVSLKRDNISRQSKFPRDLTCSPISLVECVHFCGY